MKSTQAEQWRPIPGYEEYYEISDQGRVRSKDRRVLAKNGSTRFLKGRILKLARMKSGHRMVCLQVNKKPDWRLVHRLVLEAFVGPCPDGMMSCHWNDIPYDNRVENLRWGTHSDNMLDRTRNGIDNNGTKNATHCKRGHAFDEANTIVYKDGHRACRECKNAADRRRSAAKRQPKPERTHCKRGHKLEMPNLRKAQLPKRYCKACHQASAYARHHDLLEHMQEISDRYYKKLMTD